jgi:hypothetical protein
MNNTNESPEVPSPASAKRFERENWVVTILAMIVATSLIIFMPAIVLKISPEVHSLNVAPVIRGFWFAIFLTGWGGFFLGKFDSRLRSLDNYSLVRWAVRGLMVLATIGVWFFCYHAQLWLSWLR